MHRFRYLWPARSRPSATTAARSSSCEPTAGCCCAFLSWSLPSGSPCSASCCGTAWHWCIALVAAPGPDCRPCGGDVRLADSSPPCTAATSSRCRARSRAPASASRSGWRTRSRSIARATQAAVAALAPSARASSAHPDGSGSPRPSIDEDPVDAGPRMLRDDAGPLLVFVGRLVPEKGADPICCRLCIARSEFPAVVALIVGDGPERASTRTGTRATRDRRSRQLRRLAFAGRRCSGGCARRTHLVGPSRPGRTARPRPRVSRSPRRCSPASGVATADWRHRRRDPRMKRRASWCRPDRRTQIADAVRRLVARAEPSRDRLAEADGRSRRRNSRAKSSARRFSALYGRLRTAALQRP